MSTWQSLGINISNINGQGKTLCPKCSSTRKKSTDPCLSVNVAEGVYNCHNCHWTGSLNGKIFPNDPGHSLTDKTIDFFKKRGISRETLEKANVTEGLTFIANGVRNTIRFNYYRDSRCVNIKYRDAEKNFKLYKGAELIFYNLDAIKNTDEVIITEGEIDCLSFIEAGINSVVSVPTGANKNTEYIANCWQYFKDKKKIYICVDKDEPGKVLENELLRVFGKDVCYIINHPFKDANELLTTAGPEELKWVYQEATRLPLDEIQYLDEESMLNQFRNGRVRGTTAYFPPIRDHFSWKKGQVTLFHGIGSLGKSTFVYFLLVLKAINEGTKWGIFSPEHYPADDFYDPLVQCYLAQNTDKYYKNVCSESDYIEGMRFIKQHFFYVNTAITTPENINAKFKELIVRHGIEGCVIDPFNQLDKDLERSIKHSREDLYISSFLTDEKRFAQKHDVYKIIIAHPKVMNRDKDGAYPCPTVYDIHGGSMWINKCDNVIAIHAPKWHENKADTERLIDIQKIKMHRLVGVPGQITIYYDRAQNRFTDSFTQTSFEPVK